jgi:ELWxxDGT repeat protein
MLKGILTSILCVTISAISAQTNIISKVIDVNPLGNGYPREFCIYNNKLFFVADSAFTAQLYSTDGTAVGTRLVKKIATQGSIGINHLTLCNGLIFFIADDGTHGAELWTTDGSAAGTSMVKDINPGGHGVLNSTLCELNGRLLFPANDGIHGTELWISDGTAGGTHMLKDIGSTGSSYTDEFVKYNSKAYFTAADLANGKEVWVTDGTDTGTHLLKDINPVGNADPQLWCVFNNHLFFRVEHSHSPTDNTELWISDGTDTGTHIFKEIVPGGWGSYPIGYAIANGRLYFAAMELQPNNNTIYKLFSTDGTDTGTHSIVETVAAFRGLAFDNKLYFPHSDTANNSELWVTDGTISGTHLVKEIHPGLVGASIALKTAYNGRLYFAADDGTSGSELWTTDGTATGTHKITFNGPPCPDPLYFGGAFIGKDSILFFPAIYDVGGVELYRYGPNPLDVPVITQSSYALYPNPATQNITIDCNDLKSISVYDIDGHKVLNASRKTFSVDNLPTGLYTVIITILNGAKSKGQFVKIGQ